MNLSKKCNQNHTSIIIYVGLFVKLIWCNIGPKSFLYLGLHSSLFSPDGAVKYDYGSDVRYISIYPNIEIINHDTILAFECIDTLEQTV